MNHKTFRQWFQDIIFNTIHTVALWWRLIEITCDCNLFSCTLGLYFFDRYWACDENVVAMPWCSKIVVWIFAWQAPVGIQYVTVLDEWSEASCFKSCTSVQTKPRELNNFVCNFTELILENFCTAKIYLITSDNTRISQGFLKHWAWWKVCCNVLMQQNRCVNFGQKSTGWNTFFVHCCQVS